MRAPLLTTVRPTSPLAQVGRAAPSLAADLRELLKPGISAFVAVTAAAGYLFGAPAEGPTAGLAPAALAALVAGTALTAGGSGALNHLLEREADRRMKRTRARPLAAGRLAPRFVLAYGLAMIGLGLGLLLAFVNALTAGLALLTALAYVGVYTPLKRVTTLNTLVGAVPGALPALGGFAAATGTLGAGGWAAFAIVYLWQLPHFLSLAWLYREDYARGGFVMLPVVEPDGRSTSWHALSAAVLLVGAGVVPFVLGHAGGVYLVGMLGLGVWFVRPAWAFHAMRTAGSARGLLLASIAYVPGFFGLVVLDHLLRWAL